MEGQRSWEGFAGLQTLHIKDFALVADETVYFSPGVNIITGESGSGKSVLVSDSLALGSHPGTGTRDNLCHPTTRRSKL